MPPLQEEKATERLGDLPRATQRDVAEPESRPQAPRGGGAAIPCSPEMSSEGGVQLPRPSSSQTCRLPLQPHLWCYASWLLFQTPRESRCFSHRDSTGWGLCGCVSSGRCVSLLPLMWGCARKVVPPALLDRPPWHCYDTLLVETPWTPGHSPPPFLCLPLRALASHTSSALRVPPTPALHPDYACSLSGLCLGGSSPTLQPPCKPLHVHPECPSHSTSRVADIWRCSWVRSPGKLGWLPVCPFSEPGEGSHLGVSPTLLPPRFPSKLAETRAGPAASATCLCSCLFRGRERL